MVYDYFCEKCGDTQEQYHGMTEKPIILCSICKIPMFKLIGTGQQFIGVNGRNNMYNFVDYNTTGQPIVINGRRQWKQHLKSLGMHDDVSNTPRTKSQVEQMARDKVNQKIIKRKEIKQGVINAYKQRNTSGFKQRVKQQLIKKER